MEEIAEGFVDGDLVGREREKSRTDLEIIKDREASPWGESGEFERVWRRIKEGMEAIEGFKHAQHSFHGLRVYGFERYGFCGTEKKEEVM